MARRSGCLRVSPSRLIMNKNNRFLFRILLVQSKENDFLAFSRTLENSHVASRITRFVTAEEALKGLAQDASSFDLIVVDNKLPCMSGLGFCRELIERKFSLPVVFLTEPDNEDFAIQFHKLGFVNDYLIKDSDQSYLEVLPLLLSEVARKYGDIIARERHKKAVQAFERRFRTLLAKNADGVIIVNKDGNVELVNPAAKSLFDRKGREFAGKPFEFPVVSGETTEIEITRKDGKKVIAEMRVAEIEWKRKKACLASLRDITYRKQMEEALESANQHLSQTVEELKKANQKILEQQKAVIEEERLKLLLQMAGTTAHELNEPLMTLLGNIELMGITKDSPEKLAQCMSKIEEAGEQISGIVKKIQTIRHEEIVPHISENLTITPGQRTRILSVEDTDEDFKIIDDILKFHNHFSLFRTECIKDALQVLASVQFDLVLSEYLLPDGNAMDFLKRIYEKGMETPMVVITSQGDEMIASQVIQAGAFGYMPKTKISDKAIVETIINAIEKGRLRREIKQAHKRIAEMSVKDELTGLYNRRYFKESVKQEVARSVRYGTDMVLCMLDLDHFKQVNDNYGHSAGDMVLAVMGRKLRKWTRESDIVCRFGGEEFVIILPNTDVKMAMIIGERMRQMMASHTFEFNSLQFQVTVSVGIAAFDESQETSSDDLIEMADQALYQAKETGRNKVVEFIPAEKEAEPETE